MDVEPDFKKLEGKTIRKVERYKIHDDYWDTDFDDTPFAEIEFTDGTKCRLIAEYGDCTGKSEDEYQRLLKIVWLDNTKKEG